MNKQTLSILLALCVIHFSVVSFAQKGGPGHETTITHDSRYFRDSILEEKNIFIITNDSFYSRRIVNSSLKEEDSKPINLIKESFIVELQQLGLEDWKTIEAKSRQQNYCDTVLPIIITYTMNDDSRTFSIRNSGNCYPTEVEGFMNKLFLFLQRHEHNQ